MLATWVVSTRLLVTVLCLSSRLMLKCRLVSARVETVLLAADVMASWSWCALVSGVVSDGMVECSSLQDLWLSTSEVVALRFRHLMFA